MKKIEQILKTKNLTKEVKKIAIELGSDLVGIAPIERFKNAPTKMFSGMSC